MRADVQTRRFNAAYYHHNNEAYIHSPYLSGPVGELSFEDDSDLDSSGSEPTPRAQQIPVFQETSTRGSTENLIETDGDDVRRDGKSYHIVSLFH